MKFLNKLKKISFLASPKNVHTDTGASKECSNIVLKQIKSLIKIKGPISVSEYMKIVLTTSNHGYYMKKDVFGTKGDFITSPEISQMFGELIGIWSINEWTRIGSPKNFQVTELGPGRGTLADDILRVYCQFPDIIKATSLHLVDISDKLKAIQRTNLSNDCSSQNTSEIKEETLSKRGKVKIQWHKDLSTVPATCGFYLAHEFFDALPINKFHKVNGKWREILVDICKPETNNLHFVLSSSETAATAMLHDRLDKAGKNKEHMEISPDSIIYIHHLSKRIARDGGCALIIDYGHTGEKSDTFRAFRQHALVDPLSEPGFSDLTADVNFSFLYETVKDIVDVYGPVTQKQFLNQMGIDVRLKLDTWFLPGYTRSCQMRHLLFDAEMSSIA